MHFISALSMTQVNSVISKVDDWVWGWPLIILILGVGIVLTLRTKFVQIFHLGKALKYMVKNEDNGVGEVTSFGALCTALSATIGTGNIVGVATAVAAGGPGALLWMIIAAFFGMATKYSEGLLAVKYREVDKDNHTLGGPFYYIEKGMGKKWKWLAILFAIFGVCAGIFGIGTFTQINGITSAAQRIFTNATPLATIGAGEGAVSITWPLIITGAVITIFAALVIIGGAKRIAKVSEFVVPFMAITYVIFALIIILFNVTKLPMAIALVFKSAFSVKSISGAIAGITVKIAIQRGVGRGIFSNEAGLGSAPIAAAAAKTKEPVRQGLVCMTGTFIDTIVICTMTGLSIVLTGAWNPEITGQQLQGFNITAYAWEHGLPFNGTVSTVILSICLVFFAFTTILGWDYYSERCIEYLTHNKKVVKVYRWIYILAVAIGPYMTISAVWNIADVTNALMAFPNLIALLALSGVVAKTTKEYMDRNKKLSHSLK